MYPLLTHCLKVKKCRGALKDCCTILECIEWQNNQSSIRFEVHEAIVWCFLTQRIAFFLFRSSYVVSCNNYFVTSSLFKVHSSNHQFQKLLAPIETFHSGGCCWEFAQLLCHFRLEGHMTSIVLPFFEPLPPLTAKWCHCYKIAWHLLTGHMYFMFGPSI